MATLRSETFSQRVYDELAKNKLITELRINPSWDPNSQSDFRLFTFKINDICIFFHIPNFSEYGLFLHFIDSLSDAVYIYGDDVNLMVKEAVIRMKI